MSNLVFQLCVSAVSGWVNRGQQQAIEYLVEENLRTILSELLIHYHSERNHQGPDNELLTPLPANANADGPIRCRERIGGVLKYYYREAA